MVAISLVLVWFWFVIFLKMASLVKNMYRLPRIFFRPLKIISTYPRLKIDNSRFSNRNSTPVSHPDTFHWPCPFLTAVTSPPPPPPRWRRRYGLLRCSARNVSRRHRQQLRRQSQALLTLLCESSGGGDGGGVFSRSDASLSLPRRRFFFLKLSASLPGEHNRLSACQLLTRHNTDHLLQDLIIGV